MIGRILNAILKETKAFMSETGGQVMLKTNFTPAKMPDYLMPLVLVELDEAPESVCYLSGLTAMDWKIAFNCYNYEPDAYVDDPSEYSTSRLYNPVDTIRDHFTLGPMGDGLVFKTDPLIPGIIYQVAYQPIVYNSQSLSVGDFFTCLEGITSFTSPLNGYVVGTAWLTQDMATMFNEYGLQFTYMGVTIATPLSHNDAIIMGYKILFDTTSIDGFTQFTETSRILETVTQVDNPPFSPGEHIS